jgi:hypothetical protein
MLYNILQPSPFSVTTHVLILCYTQDSILPLFALNVKYGLPCLSSPPSDIETQQSVSQNLELLTVRLSRAKAIALQSNVMGNFVWVWGTYSVTAHARTEGM